MLHPEMTRALADQHIRDLHREAAQHRAAAPAAAPVALHWAALAMRLHLSRAHAAATTPVGPGRRLGRARDEEQRGHHGGHGRPGADGLHRMSGTTPDGSAGPGPSTASIRLDTVVLDCPDPARPGPLLRRPARPAGGPGRRR